MYPKNPKDFISKINHYQTVKSEINLLPNIFWNAL